MVQRKASSKLGIQADTKTCSHQDTKNRGTELKKKMKKSRSIKLSDLESLRQSPVGRAKSRFDMPCNNMTSSAATPQKSSSNRTSYGSPNYMKSTTSSAARKERSQVSSHGSQTSSASRSSNKRSSSCSKFSSASSVHKPMRTLAKTSSLKPVRTLTKMASIKAARPSMNKCSGVALCPNLNVGRATCSSTLRDSKFPDYVMLHPGGTESEGTSFMKVCPYTYCSLNGHHHAQLPPLKHFLSVRRRLLRTQKSIKQRGLSPVRSKPPDEGKKQLDTGQAEFGGSPIIGTVLDSTAASEVGTDFFIEIYAISRGDKDESFGESINHHIEGRSSNSAVNPDVNRSITLSDVEKEQGDDENATKMLPDESSYSEMNFEDHFDQNSEFLATEVDIPMLFLDRGLQVEVDDAGNSSCLMQEEKILKSTGSGSKDKIPAQIELDESISEAIDMDWEDEQDVITCGPDDPILSDDLSDSIVACLPEFENPAVHWELFLKPDDAISQCFEDIIVDGEAREDIQKEYIESFNAEFAEDKNFLNKDAFEKPTATLEGQDREDNMGTDSIDNMVSPYSAEDPLELTADSEDKNALVEADDQFHREYILLENNEPNYIADVALEIDANKQKANSVQDDPELLHNAAAIDPIIGTEDVTQLSTPEDETSTLQEQTFGSTDEGADYYVPTSDDHSPEQGCHSVDVIVEMGKEVDDSNALLELETSDSGKDFSEADVEVGKENHNPDHYTIEHCLIDSLAGEDNLYQEVSNKILLCDTQTHSSQTDGSIIVDNLEVSGNDQEHKGPGGSGSSFVDGIIDESEKIQVQDGDEPNAAETLLTAIKSTHSEDENTQINAGNHSAQQMSKNCTNLQGKTRCKRPIKNVEEEREFNPGEPRYLPVQPDPDTEKVDLRHQMIDERKNSEEWMLDYALRQAVNKLAPARKRKVALLVEAFEAVTPLPKYEPHLRHTTTDFVHPRSIQACS